jgi:hypothetical protein
MRIDAQRLFLISVLGVGCLAAPSRAGNPPLSDIPTTPSWVDGTVGRLARLQILRGYPDGTFKGRRALSRYELATGLARFQDHVRTLIKEREDEKGPPGPQLPQGPQGARGGVGAQGPRGPSGPAGQRPAELNGLERDLRSLQADLDRVRTDFSQIGKDIPPARGSVQESWEELEAITRRMHRVEKPIPGILRGHERRRDR